MKKFFLIPLLLFAVTAMAQLNPVSWNYSAKKISDKTYEIHLTATVQPGWHIYSQTQPDDAIAMPTEINFKPNPLILPDGKIKEVGRVEKYHDKQLNLSANQYSDKVHFVQVIKLKTNAKTNFTGTVTYQTCDDKKCLPPKTVNFSIPIS